MAVPFCKSCSYRCNLQRSTGSIQIQNLLFFIVHDNTEFCEICSQTVVNLLLSNEIF